MIRLEKAVIHAYKCIGEGQSFEIKKNITAVMGVNEAGKTSVLEALAKANYLNPQDERFAYHDVYDYPRYRKRGTIRETMALPVITLTYRVDEKLADEIEQEMMLAPKKTCFSRITNYSGEGKIIDNGFEYSVNAFLSAYAERKDATIEKFIKSLMEVYDKRGFLRFLEHVKNDITQEEKSALEHLMPYFENKHEWENPINEYVYRKYLLPNIPKFLYYDEYFMMPSRVSVERLANDTDLTDAERTSKALLLLADIDLDKMTQSMDYEVYKSELELLQSEFTKDFLKYWSINQDLAIEFELIQEEKEKQEDTEGKGLFSFLKKQKQEKEYETFLEVRVCDKRDMISVPLSSRSRGFNWFFSFWVWFKAIQKERACSFVFLLDEPGLNLHMNAQKDLMKLIKDISKQDQVIFATHSPYMLEEAEGNIYCIANGENGSTISPWEKTGEKD